MKTTAATLLSMAFALIATLTCFSQSVRYEPQNNRYIGSAVGTQYPWTITARTGLVDDVCTAFMKCLGVDTIPRKKTDQWYISENIKGFWEYLPDGYNDPVNKDRTYALLIYIHGCAGPGDGSLYMNGTSINRSVGLGKVLNEPLPSRLLGNPRYFSNIPVKKPGAQPAFTGNRTSMIIMMPQYAGCQVPYFPSPEDIDACVEKAFSLYRVDRTRVYITGVSGGGQPTYQYPAAKDEYARKVTAIAPVCATQWLMGPRAEEYATRLVHNGVNVLGVCNIYDYTIGGLTFRMNRLTMQNIMSVPGIAPYQADTAFFTYPGQTPNVSNHDAYRKGYHPNNLEYSSKLENYGGPLWTDPANGEGYNLYEWLVSKSKVNVLPIIDMNFSVKPTNDAVLLTWSNPESATAARFAVERSENGKYFNTISTVDPRPTSGRMLYQYMDKELPQSTSIYYRIRVLTNDPDDDITSRTLRVRNPEIDGQISVPENLVTDQVKILFSKRTSARIELLDQAGSTTISKEVWQSQQATVDIARLPIGLYVIRVVTSTGTIRSFRIMKK